MTKRRIRITIDVDYEETTKDKAFRQKVGNYALEVAKDAYGDRMVFCSTEEINLNLEGK